MRVAITDTTEVHVQARHLGRMFELSYGVLFRNLEGVTHAESLFEPQPAGNCLNWVLGHIVATRNRVMTLVGRPTPWPKEQAFLYSGREEAAWSADRALPLDLIKTDLARSQQQLLAALEDMPDSALAAPLETGQVVGDMLAFFHFHETYHGGQIALLRRLLGHPGVIKPPVSNRLSTGVRI